MKYLIYFTFILILFASCAPSKKMIKTDKQRAESKASQYDESFDPLSLNDDDIVIAKPVKKSESQSKPAEVKKPEKNKNLTATEEADGFRVQIFASRSVEGATIAQQKAKDKFEPLKQKVYWIFEAPFYKIRVGDAKDRSQAEEILEQAKNLGYDHSFIVRSKVNILKNSSLNNY